MWHQKEIIINNNKRGFHLITDEIIQNYSELNKISIGLLHIFIKHTSASLIINENYKVTKTNRRILFTIKLIIIILLIIVILMLLSKFIK